MNQVSNNPKLRVVLCREIVASYNYEKYREIWNDLLAAAYSLRTTWADKWRSCGLPNTARPPPATPNKRSCPRTI